LAHFINVACKIRGKITSWARDANSRDRKDTLVRLETEITFLQSNQCSCWQCAGHTVVKREVYIIHLSQTEYSTSTTDRNFSKSRQLGQVFGTLDSICCKPLHSI